MQPKRQTTNPGTYKIQVEPQRQVLTNNYLQNNFLQNNYLLSNHSSSNRFPTSEYKDQYSVSNYPVSRSPISNYRVPSYIVPTQSQKTYHNSAIRHRTSFKFLEQVNDLEDLYIEYKNYLPAYGQKIYNNKRSDFELKNLVIAFLNVRGGRVFFGINDKRQVIGLEMTDKQRDDFLQLIVTTAKGINPSFYAKDYLTVHFIPIKDDKNQWIPDRFVIKVIVKQGDQKELYTTAGKKMMAFIRQEANVTEIKADEMKRDLIDRMSGKAKDPKIHPSEFEDPYPEKPVYQQQRMPRNISDNSSGNQRIGARQSGQMVRPVSSNNRVFRRV